MATAESPLDAQKSQVYAAESESVPEGAHYQTAEEIERFLAGIFTTAWFLAQYPEATRYEVQAVPYQSYACGWGECGICHMELPPWARKQSVILHELAHGLTDLKHDGKPIAHHGLEFCTVFLELVTQCMGRDAGQKLQASFHKHQVEFLIPQPCYNSGETSMNTDKLKYWGWEFLTKPPLGIIYFCIIAAGMREMMPFLALRLHRLPIPLFHNMRHFEGFHLLDMAHVLAIMLLMAVWYFWTVILKILFGVEDFKGQGKNPEARKNFTIILGISILLADAILFYSALLEQVAWGGSVLSFQALVGTVAYIGILLFVSYVSVNLDIASRVEEEEEP